MAHNTFSFRKFRYTVFIWPFHICLQWKWNVYIFQWMCPIQNMFVAIYFSNFIVQCYKDVFLLVFNFCSLVVFLLEFITFYLHKFC